ncbi:MAG: hypothetical protein WAQ52_13385 [Terriglobales bacterium]
MAPNFRDYNLLVISDLHLSEGIRPHSKKYSLKEDFFFDREFARFLAHYQNPSEWGGKKWHLIINGDLLDLLQVTAYRDAPAALHRPSKHPEYGLDCGELESVYKLGKIVEGHGEFFQALAEFVAGGNLLSVIKGNHDVELHYPAVRKAFLERLQNAYESIRTAEAITESGASRIKAETVQFPDWFYYEEGLLWVEHGNQYDRVNVFPYFLSPLLPKAPGRSAERVNEIDLPWGSLFVRYLFNKIETVEPFADNIKPQALFIRWLFRKHPMTALKFAVFDGGFMLRKIRRAWTPAKPGSYATREQEHAVRLKVLADEWRIPEADLCYLDGLRSKSLLTETSSLRWRIARAILCRPPVLQPLLVAVAILIAIGVVVAVSPLFGAVIPSAIRKFLWERWRVIQSAITVVQWIVFPMVVVAAVMFVRWLFRGEAKKETSNLAVQSRAIAKRLGVQGVLMGHTHDADLMSIGDHGEEYFNTGTWTKVFSEEERLVRDDIEFVFVQGLRKNGGLQLKLMEWDDGAQEPRLLKLFEDPGDER